MSIGFPIFIFGVRLPAMAVLSKRKVGRPSKGDEARRRGHSYTVKFSRSEDVRLHQLRGDKPVAAYLRECGLKEQ